MIEEIKGGVKLHLFIQPKAAKNEIVGPHNGALKVKVAAPPLEGRANDELVEFIASIFKTAKRNVILSKGEGSRHKVVHILEVSLSEAKEILGLT